jgi:hypothetical protein
MHTSLQTKHLEFQIHELNGKIYDLSASFASLGNSVVERLVKHAYINSNNSLCLVYQTTAPSDVTEPPVYILIDRTNHYSASS